ncbi:hypothetical protein [Winogradskyella helgolandensis]|uniref:hypothetical protein n=1 Tax=Winogradskyella helgolandensis TaxID=2697010 RepID=UPI0015C81702|nr:hypothetical protein [Winogradskyella helgolandensis]
MVTLSLLTCSNSDDSSNLNEVGQGLIGEWYFDNPVIYGVATNNSFVFNSSGEVIYNNWSGDADYDFNSEVGSFSVDGDILTMIFPEGVELTFVQLVAFENDYKVYFQPVSGSQYEAYEGDYFREGYTGPYDYDIQVSGYSSSDQQYPLAITYYWDNESGNLETHTINSQTNTDINESYNVNAFDKIGFKYDVSGYEDSRVNSIYIKNLETETVIFNESIFEIENGQMFLFDISEGTYTIE